MTVLGVFYLSIAKPDLSYFSYESSNPIYGATTNPHDTGRSPGGSSGGEAALIGAGGSVLGMGSDIAGSIRIPAHFCGIYGLKSTPGRLRLVYKSIYI